MSESLRRVTAGTSAAIRDWVAESATRNTVAKRTPTPRTESPAVVQLAERRNPESVGARLDELRRQMLAEYEVDGKSVRVSPAFRSLHGVSARQQGAYLAAIKKAVGPERFAKLAPHALAATCGDPTLGGSQRTAWLYNEKSGEWGYWDRFGQFRTSSRPYDHDVDGVFRPRSEQ